MGRAEQVTYRDWALSVLVLQLMWGLSSEAARSAVGRPDVVWSEHLGLAVNCVEEPTQQECACDYRNGEQATQEVRTIGRLPNRIGHGHSIVREHANRLDG